MGSRIISRTYVRIYNRSDPKRERAKRRGEKPLPPSRWVVRWKDGNGAWHERSAGRIKDDAEDLRDEIKAHLLSNRPLPWEAPPFSKICEDFLKYRREDLKPNTYDDYSQVINNHLLPLFGNMPIGLISPQDIEEFKIFLRQTKSLKPATCAKILRVLRVIFRHPAMRQYIYSDPTLGVKVPRQDRPEQDYLNAREVHLLLEASSPAKRPIFGVASYGGLRQGEIIALRWGDVDLGKGIINVNKSYDPQHGLGPPKTKTSIRSVWIPPTLIKLLKQHKAASKNTKANDLVFPSQAGTYLDSRNLTGRDLARALDAAGIRKIDFHALRHTFGALSIEAGTNLKTIQTLMGHSSIAVTLDIYGHLFPTAYERHVSGLEALISSEEEPQELP